MGWLEVNQSIGQFLAVSWSDTTVDVVSLETGSALQHFRQVTNSHGKPNSDPSAAANSVTCIGWGLSLVDLKSIAGSNLAGMSEPNTQNSQPKVSLDDFLDREPDPELLGLTTDLPDQLARFDATDLMPKLPALPPLPTPGPRMGQPPLNEIFASQSLLETALHKGSSKELHFLNTFLLSDSKGSIQVILYDSLNIGSIVIPELQQDSTVEYLRHASHPLAHSHVVIAKIKTGEQEHLGLIPISLRFLKSVGRNVHFIDFKTAQLEMLVQYIGECVSVIHHHWKHARDLPRRFQQNITEDLAEKGMPTLTQSLYQLAATGRCSKLLKKWLTGELAERVRE
jgi:anaphase-promoting complex subunit 4